MAESYESSMTDSYREKLESSILNLHHEVLAGLKEFGEYSYSVDIKPPGYTPSDAASFGLSQVVPLYSPEVIRNYQGPILEVPQKAESFAKDVMKGILEEFNFRSGEYRVLVTIHTPNRPSAPARVVSVMEVTYPTYPCSLL